MLRNWRAGLWCLLALVRLERSMRQTEATLAQINPGGFFEIRVDGKVRSYRDRREVAIDAGNYLKQKNPSSKVEVRDTRDGSVVVIGQK